jgi:phosphomannomutase/phosphoglucomutase
MTAAMIVNIIAQTGEKLSSIVNNLPKRSMIKDKISLLNGDEVIEHLKIVYSHETIDTTDGIKIFKDRSWALIRASGTEPVIRVIIDSDDSGTAHSFHDELKKHIAAVTLK